jgi:hypothetical protein
MMLSFGTGPAPGNLLHFPSLQASVTSSQHIPCVWSCLHVEKLLIQERHNYRFIELGSYIFLNIISTHSAQGKGHGLHGSLVGSQTKKSQKPFWPVV